MFELYWSAGNGMGWPQSAVLRTLKDRFGFPERPGYMWAWGTPFMVNSSGPHPFIISCDPQKAQVALLAGEDIAFLPDLMGEPQNPPVGYSEHYRSTGDPWLQGIL